MTQRLWQIRNGLGQPIDFVCAKSADDAIRISRESRKHTDSYYDFLYRVKRVDGADIFLEK